MPRRYQNSTLQITEFQPATINFSSLPPQERNNKKKITKVPRIQREPNSGWIFVIEDAKRDCEPETKFSAATVISASVKNKTTMWMPKNETSENKGKALCNVDAKK